jgi:hypothetical protein
MTPPHTPPTNGGDSGTPGHALEWTTRPSQGSMDSGGGPAALLQ